MKSKLRDLCSSIEVKQVIGNDNLDVVIDDLSTHSKKISPTTLFFAHKGVASDGRFFIEEVLDAGVGAIISDTRNDNFNFSLYQNSSVPIVLVEDAKHAKAVIAKKFFLPDNPSILMIAVTGTNGKTSTAWIIAKALTTMGFPCAYVGTIGQRYYSPAQKQEVVYDAKTTSPDVIDLYRFLGTAHQDGVKGVAIEVSSHSIDQKRLGDVDWDVAVFTNLTQDHLDYHGTLENYASVKKKLFIEELKKSRKKFKVATVNIGDAVGSFLFDWCRKNAPEIKCLGYTLRGTEGDSVVLYHKFHQHSTDLKFNLDGDIVKVNSKLVGDFNVENMLASASVLSGLSQKLGLTTEQVARGLSSVPPVPGRLERIENDKLSVFVDYAHTPDALFRAQDSLRKLTNGGKLITVFGCGGDRDKTKRPKMATEVEKLSDYAVVTSDNPRSENPDAIIKDILAGFKSSEFDSNGKVSYEVGGAVSLNGGSSKLFEYVVITDRREAIKHAITTATPGDVILIAGKGHEDYQEISGKRHHFSDKEECIVAMTGM